MTFNLRNTLILSTLSFCLSGCAGLPLDGLRSLIGLTQPDTQVSLPVPAAWQAPLPHGGQLKQLSSWWQQFNDPLLIELIEAAQNVSPSVASAKSRIDQAHNKHLAATAGLLPEITGNASIGKGLESLFFPAATIQSIGLASQWELDVFGSHAAGVTAAKARYAGANSAWHDARVIVAAEVANQYNTLRSCEAQRAFAQHDLNSRKQSLQLTTTLSDAGLKTIADHSLAEASSAQATNTLLNYTARCDLAIKALVALTGKAEKTLRQQLQGAQGKLTQPSSLAISTVPAAALAQRPDIFAAAYDVLAASADTSQLHAQRYPKISFSGKISAMHMEIASVPQGGTVWSIGPLAVSVPLFDGGLRSANVAAARARYEEAKALYAAKLRQAVREVEEALITLNSLQTRRSSLESAAAGYLQSYDAKTALYNVGLANLLDVEELRRTHVQAQTLLLDLQREQIAAWIALYRALGGGWTVADTQVIDAHSVVFR